MNDLEKKLIQRVKRGDREAFDRLFEDYYQNLCNFAFLMVRDETAAEEIVTEVFTGYGANIMRSISGHP